MPKVTVIIPTYNRGPFLTKAIESVLAQTFSDFELIVINDGSTDATKDILAAYKDRLINIYQENKGISAARNRGIRQASGEYIAFLDSDDHWVPEKLARQVAILDAHKDVGIVYGRMPIINSKGECVGTKPSGFSGRNFKELVEFWGDLPTSSVMTRKECFDQFGLFDETMPTMEDIDMWIRISHEYRLYEIEDITLAYYQRHETQVTKVRTKVYEGLLKADLKILRNYSDVPVKLLTKRVSFNQYLLARSYDKDNKATLAFSNAVAAIARNPLLGTMFFTKDDHVLMKLLKLVKPYSFLPLAFLKAFFTILRKLLRSGADEDRH